MRLGSRSANVTRGQILQRYQQSPESAPLKLPAMVSTLAAKDYRFETELARFTGGTAAELAAEAAHDAARVKHGAGGAITRGVLAACGGVAAFYDTSAVPLLFWPPCRACTSP